MAGIRNGCATPGAPGIRGLLAALIVLLLSASCAPAELLDDGRASAPSTVSAADRVAASTFPVMSGYTYEPIPEDVWPQIWANLSNDFDQGLADAVGKGVDDAEGDRVAVLLVATPVPSQASRDQMLAAMKKQTQRAAGAFGVAASDDIAGHEVLMFTDDAGHPNWYWISGGEFVIVTAADEQRGGVIAAQLSAQTL